jgi:hydrogenase expression/formation protein HypC
MCLAIPLKIIKINGQKAIVQSNEHSHEVDLSLVSNVEIGDYLVCKGDLAINKIPREDAEKIIDLVQKTINEQNK